MIWLKVLSVTALIASVWQRYRKLGQPIIRGGKRWWRQPDGRYAPWHGIGLKREEELPPE